ncbi:MAG: S8 family peptidase [Rhodothermales bacterium]
MIRTVIKSLLLLLLAVEVTLAQPLTNEEVAKLDPRFRGVVARAMPELGLSIQAPSVKPVAYQPALSGKQGSALYGAVIFTDAPDLLRAAGIEPQTLQPLFVTARVTPEALAKLARLEAVQYVHAGVTYAPTNDVARGLVGADLLHAGHLNNTPYKGEGVIVAVIDTGIDWEHLDFRDPDDPTKTRIRYLWDVTLTPEGTEKSPGEACCTYGVEYTQADIEDEIDGSPAGFVRERDVVGHGTHVAGTAAGNGAAKPSAKYAGISPEADLVIVKAGIDKFETVNVINAMAYIREKAALLGQPVVVNMSLGTDYGPHDGTMPEEVMINSFTGPGRVVVVSAGNSGGSDSHIAGTIEEGATSEFTINVPAYTLAEPPDDDTLDFNVWFNGADEVSVMLVTPGGTTLRQAPDGDRTSETNDGTVFLYNHVSNFNGDREVLVRAYAKDEESTIGAGVWTVRIRNEVSSARGKTGSALDYHAWLFGYFIGDYERITIDGGDSDYTVGAPSTADEAISVAAWTHSWRWMSEHDGGRISSGGEDYSDNIATFSSKGPRRDDNASKGGNAVMKPDITAPGERTPSSLASTAVENRHPATILPGRSYVVSRGTSMAAPVVSGAVALLLQHNPYLSPSGVKDLLNRSADTDDYTGALPNYTWGYGKLNVFKAMVAAVDPGVQVDRNMLVFDQWNVADDTKPLGDPNWQKFSLRFTPEKTGVLTGLFLHTSFNKALTGPLHVELWSSRGSGRPRARLGNTVVIDPDQVSAFSWNFFNLIEGGFQVTGGVDYHVIVYPENAGDILEVLLDVGDVDDHTMVFNGAAWIDHDGDLRARPVISTALGHIAQANRAPTPAIITAPDSNATFVLEGNPADPFTVEWEASIDPDGDALTYTWQLGASHDLAQPFLSQDLGAATRYETDFGTLGGLLTDNGIILNETVELWHRVDASDGVLSTPGTAVPIVFMRGTLTDAETEEALPEDFALRGNYPNPFNPTTAILFDLPETANIHVTLFDVTGRKVLTTPPQSIAAGARRSVLVDASPLPSGVYLYQVTMQTVNRTEHTRGRLIVIK